MSTRKEYDYTCPYYLCSLDLTSILIKQVLHNNSYLIKKKGITLSEQFTFFRSQGITFTYSFYKKLMSGDRKGCKLTLLAFFALYWKIPLIELMSVDFKERDLLMSM